MLIRRKKLRLEFSMRNSCCLSRDIVLKLEEMPGTVYAVRMISLNPIGKGGRGDTHNFWIVGGTHLSRVSHLIAHASEIGEEYGYGILEVKSYSDIKLPFGVAA